VTRANTRAILSCLLAAMASPAVVADAPADSGKLAVTATPAAMLTPAALEMSRAEIGEILINNDNVFDLEDPDEDKALYRFANRIHMTTRSDVIAEQLLFQPGDRFSSQSLAESERLLRENRYLQDATIRPVRLEDGTVDIEVETSDSWTLVPKLSLSRSGGTNSGTIGVQEMNLLGTGIGVELEYKSDVDRDSALVAFTDRNLFGSRYSLNALLANNSDGSTQFLELEKPFYSLDSRNAKGFSYYKDDEIEFYYNLGEKLGDYRHQASEQEFLLGWSKGLHDGWTRRYTTGVAFDVDRFSAVANDEYPAVPIPEDRTLYYPFFGIEVLEDRYEKVTNSDQMNRTEDRFLGTRLSARLGVATETLGSDRNALIYNATAQKGFGSFESKTLLLSASLDGRLADSGSQNVTLDMSARYYWRQSEHRLLYLMLTGTLGDNLDLDQYLLIGGDSGLRGYPLRYQTGNKRALFSIEQRFFTDWYPFHLFNIGAAVFADVGRAWGEAPLTTSDNPWLSDVGFGLRIGNTRSGLGRMAHIDLAFPLNSANGIADVQFLVSTHKSF